MMCFILGKQLAPVKKCQLVSSLQEYQHHTMTFTLDLRQVPISRYYDECSRQQLAIQRLLKENSAFRDMLSQKQALTKVSRPHFLQELLNENAKRAAGKKICYAESFKQSCLALRILMGPMAYKILQANVEAPSLTTLKRTLQSKFAPSEGELIVHETVRCMIANGEKMYAWISEDDTKIQPRVCYNSGEDTVIGLCLPIDENGMPRKAFFKFVSIAAVREYLKAYPLSTYIKLVTLTSLSPNARSYSILIYGTKGSDTYEGACSRWKIIYEAFKSAGVEIMGSSSDGFSAYLKGMKVINNLPCSAPTCPEAYKAFFRCDYNSYILCVQDGVHMVVKMFRALGTKTLVIGKKVASRATLFSAVRHLGKGLTRVSIAELESQSDMMSFSICERASSEEVCDLLKRPEEQATKVFLILIQLVILAYIDPKTPPAARITAAWELAFFMRLWKFFLKINSRINRSAGVTEETHVFNVETSFVSSNVNECCEINAHNLIMYNDRCRDKGMPELFLPSLTGSQPNEAMFRLLRSLTTTRSTIVSFGVRDVIERIRRLWFLADHKTTAKEDKTFIYSSARENELFIPTELPSEEEVRALVHQGFINARAKMAELGCFWNSDKYPEPELSPVPTVANPELFPDEHEPDNNQDFAPTLTQPPVGAPKKGLKKTAKKGSKKTPQEGPEKCLGEKPVDIGLEDVDPIPDEVIYDDLFISNLDHLIAQKLSLDKTLEVVTIESGVDDPAAPIDIDKLIDKVPKSYIPVVRGGEHYLMKKYTVLWLLSVNSKKISSDRLRRFIGEKRVTLGNRVCVGDFIFMDDKDGEEVVCQVQSFAFKQGKKKFSGNSCPYTGDVAHAVKVLVQRFKIINRDASRFIEEEKVAPSFIDMISYKRHISLKRHVTTGDMEFRQVQVSQAHF